MTPADLLALTVRPVLAWMGEPYASREAEVMLLAIARQETGLLYRTQVGPHGPIAVGLWQFQGPTALAIASHERTAAAAERLASALGYRADDCWRALQGNDQLACAFARLLLWTDPHPLPEVGEEDRAWHSYLRLWRPGKPRPAAWTDSYAAALMAVEGAA